jgi:hypothetical protein
MNWTKKEEKLLTENYSNLSYKDLLLLFKNKNRLCIANKAKRLGLSKIGTKHLRTKINSDFFSNPDILNCYWAGFIMADGCVLFNKPNQLQIMLSSIDTNHLEQLKKDLNWEGVVRVKKKKNKNNYVEVCSISITNENITDDLKNHFNIVPRKTYTCKPPNIIDEELIFAFIAGYIDGDGSIFLQNSYPKISISGTKELLEWMKVYIDKYFPAKICYKNAELIHSKISNHMYSLHLTNQRVTKFYEYIITYNIPLLNRKWDVIKNSIELKNKQKEQRLLKQYSSYKGITFVKRLNKWVVQVYISRNVNKYLGTFLTEDEAIKALNKFKLENKIDN